MIHPATALIPRAVFTNTHLHADYQALWAAVWNGATGTDREVRAVVLSLLNEGVPAKTARPIVLAFMKGLNQ